MIPCDHDGDTNPAPPGRRPGTVTTAAPANIAAMTAAPWNLVTLAPLPPTMADEALGDLPLVVVTPDPDDPTAIEAALADAELLIYDWRASATGLTADDIAAAPHLAFIQQPSVGVPGHDTVALDAAGVPLANAAGFNAVAVAEWVLGALFGVARHLTWARAELRAGRWPQIDVIQRGPFEIGGRRVGIVGFGPIAHAVVAPLLAMGCDVSYWSRSRRPPADERGATYRDLDDLIATSDVLINVIALGDETRGPPLGATARRAARRRHRGQRQPWRHRRRARGARRRRARAPRRRRVRRLRDRAAAAPTARCGGAIASC